MKIAAIDSGLVLYEVFPTDYIEEQKVINFDNFRGGA